MAYTTFTSAWTQWKVRYPDYKTAMDGLTASMATLIAQTTIIGVRNAAYACFSNLKNAMYAHVDYQAGNEMNNYHYAACYFAWEEGGAAAVTMADILSAMLGAKFTELQDFIGIEDAYRVSLWNAPFNANFYAALARGFQKWP